MPALAGQEGQEEEQGGDRTWCDPSPALGTPHRGHLPARPRLTRAPYPYPPRHAQSGRRRRRRSGRGRRVRWAGPLLPCDRLLPAAPSPRAPPHGGNSSFAVPFRPAEEAKRQEEERQRREEEERKRQELLARLREEELQRLDEEAKELEPELRDARESLRSKEEAEAAAHEVRWFACLPPRPAGAHGAPFLAVGRLSAVQQAPRQPRGRSAEHVLGRVASGGGGGGGAPHGGGRGGRSRGTRVGQAHGPRAGAKRRAGGEATTRLRIYARVPSSPMTPSPSTPTCPLQRARCMSFARRIRALAFAKIDAATTVALLVR